MWKLLGSPIVKTFLLEPHRQHPTRVGIDNTGWITELIHIVFTPHVTRKGKSLRLLIEILDKWTTLVRVLDLRGGTLGSRTQLIF